MDTVIKREEKVIRFLRQNLGVCYCSPCLSTRIKAGSLGQIRRLIKALLTNKREYDGGNPCDFCENTPTVMFLPCA